MGTKNIAVINMKGGVGKSTLAINLSGCLAKFHGKKVLLIDNDPQANTTQYLVNREIYEKFMNDQTNFNILDIYRDRPTSSPSFVEASKEVKTPKPTVKNSIIQVRKYSSGIVDLVPSTLRLMELQETHVPRMEDRLKHFIDDIGGAYDYVIIDCPPTISPFTLSAYVACQAYLVPVKSDYLSGLGLILLRELMEKYQRTIRESRQEIGVVFTLHQNYPIPNEIRASMSETLTKSGRYVFENMIIHGTNTNRAVEKQKMFFEVPQGQVNNRQGKQVKAITVEFLKRLTEIEKPAKK